jgi:hypothetical protein
MDDEIDRDDEYEGGEKTRHLKINLSVHLGAPISRV